MRTLHLDKELRAGQRLSRLLLSRNRHDGLDKEAYIQVNFFGNNQIEVISNCNDEENRKKQEVKYDGFLKEMTQKLLKQEIVWNKDHSLDPDPFFDPLDS